MQDPFLLTGSPRCDPFSVLQNLNKYYLDNAKNREALERGERHLCLSIDLYEERWKKGKYFLHERPVGAKSWDHPRMVKLQKRAGVFTVVGPMCAWGMGLEVPKQGRGLVYKATKFVTNSKEVAKLLDRHCTNRTGGPLPSSHFAHWWIGSSLCQVPGRACVHGPPGHQEPDAC